VNVSTITGVLTGRAFKLLAGQERRQLLKAFWFAVLVLSVLAIPMIGSASIEAVIGGLLVGVAALAPAYLWCSGRVLGMPIYPVFAITHLWTCAIPILEGRRLIGTYSPNQQFVACLTVAGYLILGTLVWYSIVKSSKAFSSKRYLTLEGDAAESFFLTSFIASTLFMQGFSGGWFYFLDSGTFSILRGTLLGLNSIATFVLAYRWGTREMARKRIMLFTLALAMFIVSSAATLLIVGALTGFVLAVIGFSLGRRQVPILVIALALLCLVVLHYGKGPMRAKYFVEDRDALVQPWQYPSWFAEWFRYSADALTSNAAEADAPQSFLDRSGTIHLLLLTQDATDKGVPHLNGDTYTIIPRLLIPRFLDPEKPGSHEGTSLLNIQYGVQTREATATTTIGWGLLNEAYANFGLPGCAGLAMILGIFYGAMARWSLNTPILSARSLFTMMLLNFAIQTEFSASVYVTALFQSSVPLVVVASLYMKSRRFEAPVSSVTQRAYQLISSRGLDRAS
jgi:hypothetical protein